MVYLKLEVLVGPFSISKTTKSTVKMNLSTFTSTSSNTLLGYAMDLSANCNITLDGVGSFSPNFYKIDKGIKLILVPKSHNALSKFMLPIV